MYFSRLAAFVFEIWDVSLASGASIAAHLDASDEVQLGPRMDSTLWIGDLQPQWTEAFLGSIFASHGIQVLLLDAYGAGKSPSVTIVRDRTSGTSSGYGFVKFTSVENARKAIETLNDYQIRKGITCKIS